MSNFQVYRSLDWRKHFKSPSQNGFCIKMGRIQNFTQMKKNQPDTRIRFFAVEDEFSELKVNINNHIQLVMNCSVGDSAKISETWNAAI